MTLAAIRALFEKEIADAFGALSPAVPVVFDNVQEQPPVNADGEFVVLVLSYGNMTEPVLCPRESAIEHIRGNVQVSCYGPRSRGMKRIESLAQVAMQALNGIPAVAITNASVASARVGVISGPVPVLSGSSPHALVTVSAPFSARV